MSNLSRQVEDLEQELLNAQERCSSLDDECDKMQDRIETLEEYGTFYEWVGKYHPEIITAYEAAQRLEK